MKKQNECLECKYTGDDALWSFIIQHGAIFKEERVAVTKDKMDPEYLDLSKINAKMYADKYQVPEDKVEDAILNGMPLCPKCKGLQYVKTL